jgi:predicted nucleotidyltransferase
MLTDVDIPREEIAGFCRRNYIRRLALFGSVLGGEFGPDSDVDVLVEFEPGKTPAGRSSTWRTSSPPRSAARWTSTRPAA